MAYKRVLVKTMKAREFTRSVTDHSGSSANLSQDTGQKVEDETPYSPGSGYPTGEDTTQEDSNTPYSPGSGLEIEEGEKSSAGE